jgi:phosphoribosylformylglycinamidine synthase
MAKFSPIMEAIVEHARAGGPVLGICNGFQILCESGLLPGALVRNRSLSFICDVVTIRVETQDTPFTYGCGPGELLAVPIKHGEGCYVADPETLAALEANGQIVFRYVDRAGRATPEANPNGSLANIAGVCNETRNVVGLMPHPEHAVDRLLGGEDGLRLFRSVQAYLGQSRAVRGEPVVAGP